MSSHLDPWRHKLERLLVPGLRVRRTLGKSFINHSTSYHGSEPVNSNLQGIKIRSLRWFILCIVRLWEGPKEILMGTHSKDTRTSVKG